MMKRPSFLPSPIALLCAVLLFLLLGVFGIVAQAIVPHLMELLKTEPRLAMLGFLGLATSPMVVVFIAHQVGHRVLDKMDPTTPTSRHVLRSAWAGVHGWLTLYGTTVLTSLVMLVIHPPRPKPDTFSSSTLTLVDGLTSYAGITNAASLHTAIWILIATIVFDLEIRAHKPPRRRSS